MHEHEHEHDQFRVTVHRRLQAACSVRVALRYLYWAQEDEIWTYWLNGFSDAIEAQLS
jgi:hypothetical protein